MCLMQAAFTPITSNQPGCAQIDPAQDLDGKTVTEPSYLPGMCEPIGGELIDTIELTGPSTFCCQQQAEQP